MSLPKRIIGLTGALLLAALPHTALAQFAQVSAGDTAVKGSSSFKKSALGDIGVYERSHALVIGINSYAGQWQPRASAISDAQEVAASLKSLGFVVDKVFNPNRRQLSASFEQFFRGPGSAPNARLVIWFSGQAVTQNGKAHLLSMSRQGDPDLFNLVGHSVSLDQISRHLLAAKAKHVLSAFDACFSHSGFARVNSAPVQSISSRTAEPARQFITSCDANQIVSDSGKFRRLFLDALMGRAKVADINKDAYLTGTELGIFLTDRLSSLTENLQTPTFGKFRFAGLDRGDIVFRIPSMPIPMPLPRSAADTPGSESGTREPEPQLVQKIQRRLSLLGCYASGIDGRWGSGTARAIKQINSRRRLRPPLVSAQPDQATLDRLRSLSGRVCPVVARLPKKPREVRSGRRRHTVKRRRHRATRVYRPKPKSDPMPLFIPGTHIGR